MTSESLTINGPTVSYNNPTGRVLNLVAGSGLGVSRAKIQLYRTSPSPPATKELYSLSASVWQSD